jgi:hypothetical protein
VLPAGGYNKEPEPFGVVSYIRGEVKCFVQFVGDKNYLRTNELYDGEHASSYSKVIFKTHIISFVHTTINIKLEKQIYRRVPRNFNTL